MEILGMDFWVPQSTARIDNPIYAGKDFFREILEVTEETTLLWVKRVTQDIDASNTRVGSSSGVDVPARTLHELSAKRRLPRRRHRVSTPCLMELTSAFAPLQKNAQLNEQQHLQLFDVVCLWLHLVPKMSAEFPQAVMDQHWELFMKGYLGAFGVFLWVAIILGNYFYGEHPSIKWSELDLAAAIWLAPSHQPKM